MEKSRVVLVILVSISVYLSCNKTIEKITYFPNGKIHERIHINGKNLYGHSETYYENGQLYGEGEYYNNKMDGTWRFFYNNGSLMSIQKFKKGKLTNLNVWDEKSRQTIVNGTGSFLYKYQDGKISSQGFYKDFKQDSIWSTWFENGVKSSEIHYKNGKLLQKIIWDKSGKLIKN